ncbi:MAG TPA: hypothetical protein PK082_01860 [Phycisphaerae bacterium]|nr:hypothetical protein [Phycisphaerae bacterium]
MTLIELTVALAVAAMVAAAALAVTSRLSRFSPGGDAAESAGFVNESLQKLLAWDLQQSRRYRNVSNRDGQAGLELEGFGDIQAGTMQTKRLPVVVRYEVIKVNDEPLLVRRQQSQGAQPFTECVCRGIAAIRLLEPDRTNGDSKENDWKALPRRAMVRLLPAGTTSEETVLTYVNQ